MYYLFNDKRDTPKKNKKLGTLDKYIKVVHCDKLKKDKYYKKIEDIFKEKGKNIGKIQVRYFAEKVQNNFDIIKREIDKLCAYTYGREIEKEDIDNFFDINIKYPTKILEAMKQCGIKNFINTSTAWQHYNNED